jgi:putative ABC transport system permease protein
MVPQANRSLTSPVERIMRVLSSFGRDLTLAVRHLRQTRIISGVALLSLALGIGANVAIFSLVNALMLKALPVHEPDRLVLLGFGSERSQNTSLTHPQWEFLRDQQDVFAGMTVTGGARFNLNAGGESRPVAGLFVNGDYLNALGVTPLVGRSFTRDDDRRGGGTDGPVAVLSYGFWQREFGGDRSVVGRAIALDGHPFTVIGVTPRDFFGVQVGRAFDVAIPMGTEPIIRGPESALDRRSNWWLTVIARLAPGQSMAQAETRIRALQSRLREATMPLDWPPQDQAEYIKDPIVLTPAATGVSLLRTRYTAPLYALLGMVGLVLTVACANLANLLLAQSVSRRRELAVRLSLGAGRFQLVRQLLVESIMLSLLGAAAGLLIATWGSKALVSMLSTRTNIVALDLSMDWRVLGFTTGIGILTGLVFGVVPALRSKVVSPADALRDHSRGVVTGGGRLNFGHGLVAAQIALSFVLVFGSTLFVRTFVELTTQDAGFKADRVLLASVDLRRTGVTDEPGRLRLFEQVRDALDVVPGIEAAAASLLTPVSGSGRIQRISVPGYDAPERDRLAYFNIVTEGYFKALATPLLVGRDIGRRDSARAPAVAVVNQTFATRFFAGQNPVGRTFVIEPSGAARTDRQVEIVGMVADTKYRSLREPAPPTIYLSIAQQDRIGSSVRLAMRTTGPPMALRKAVVAAVESVNQEVVVDLRTMEEDLGASVTQERLVASLSAAFGGLALLLAVLGLYGIMSYSVNRRQNEIGIRMALGAEPGKVVRLVLFNVAIITCVGLAVGVAAAIGTGRFINAMLFNLAASDATMIAATAGTLAAAAAIAGYLPARRAARIDPMAALRRD